MQYVQFNEITRNLRIVNVKKEADNIERLSNDIEVPKELILS